MKLEVQKPFFISNLYCENFFYIGFSIHLRLGCKDEDKKKVLAEKIARHTNLNYIPFFLHLFFSPKHTLKTWFFLKQFWQHFLSYFFFVFFSRRKWKLKASFSPLQFSLFGSGKRFHTAMCFHSYETAENGVYPFLETAENAFTMTKFSKIQQHWKMKNIYIYMSFLKWTN